MSAGLMAPVMAPVPECPRIVANVSSLSENTVSLPEAGVSKRAPISYFSPLRGDNEPYNLPTVPPESFRQMTLKMLVRASSSSWTGRMGREATSQHVVESLQADDIAAFSMVASKFPQTLATPYPSTSEAPCPSTLSLAAALGSTKILLYLLTVSGSSKHLSLKSGPNKSGPAFFAASADSLKALKILKDVGVNMLEKNSAGNTPLHVACDSGATKVVAYLVKLFKGSHDPNILSDVLSAKNNMGLTPLHIAIIHDNMECVEVILAICPELIHQRALLDLTPLHLACMSIGGGNQGLVESLLAAGAQVNDQTNDQRISPLHFAAAVDATQVAGALLRAGACINAKDSSGYTPIHVCALNGSVTSAMLCVQEGGDLTVKSDLDHTALHIAAMKGDSKMALYLLSICSWVKDQPDSKGRTPLIDAIEKSHDSVVSIFLRAGAKASPECVKCASRSLVLSYLGSGELTRRATKVSKEIDLAVGGFNDASKLVFAPEENRAAVVVGETFGSTIGAHVMSFVGRGWLTPNSSSYIITTAMALDSDLKRKVEASLSGTDSSSDDDEGGFQAPMPVRKRAKRNAMAEIMARNKFGAL
mmetsp:Transcript_17421/g.32455  ORF Transcript_17421/g.32455 Transcript_17421/m.32455 type:complete len:590 (+) Transcript_17421:261-2030(+)|eukprot:CAMPEP_0182502604 /NCGR_PEP_ID=MMETSP1321-20130603/13788_1 /TAXON_ID=91990 /ORGANISM="Bolidomonas sp., Strain RCC1657" /LENGTH=589 /DNA_ID=CAMNT_0024707579 /DNA_START=171 /DNA_END=1940 /DNA_ORIENTATION=+